jgi:DNA-binding response OmpR family regulator
MTVNMSSEKILIVEDEKKISDIVKSYLKRDGFDVIPAAAGIQCIHPESFRDWMPVFTGMTTFSGMQGLRGIDPLKNFLN